METINKQKYNLKNRKIPKKKGYAIMFTVILISIISLISLGLSNTTYKQLRLSSGASDSELSFYQSDMAMECALYIDNQTTILVDGITSFTCGFDQNGVSTQLDISSTVVGDITTFNLNPIASINNSLNPCFRISVVKNNSNINITSTTIKANGYNICNIANNRTVERTIQVSY